MINTRNILQIMGLAPFAFMAPPIPEDFAFPAEVDDAETLPAEVKGLYIKQSSGKFAIDPVAKKRLDTTGLNTALRSERAKNKEFEKLLSGFKGLGFGDTPEEAMEAINAKIAEGSDGSPEGKKKLLDLKELRAKMKEEFDNTLKVELAKKDEQLTKAQRSLHKNMVEREAIAALAKLKGSQDLLLPHVVGKLGLVEDDDGNMVVRVLDKDGDPVGDGMGGFQSVEAMVLQMRSDEKFARAFDASGKGGSGRTQVGKGGGDGGGEKKSSIGKISAGLAQLK